MTGVQTCALPIFELIDELKAKDVTIVIENEELLDYKMEEFILLDRSREETYRKRYENLKKKNCSSVEQDEIIILKSSV